VDGYISERMQGAPDHPMTLTFPEGEYLKGLVVMKAARLVEKPETTPISAE
jgi:23S rRNA (cytosine1962-C5)-methyltransferase